MKLVLLEDDKILSNMASEDLSEAGFNVKCAYDGEEGLALIKSEKPDLVLMDINMPKMRGIEVLRAIRSDSEINNMPVLVISNSGNEADIEVCVNLGILDYMVKANISPSEIVRKVIGFKEMIEKGEETKSEP